MPVATFSWTIATSGDWYTASDWTPSGPPDPASMAVVAAAGGTYVVTVSPGFMYSNYPVIDRWDMLVKTP